jgi:flagellar basal body-associated protein FliL
LFTARLFRHFKELAAKKVELRSAVQATMADMKKASLSLDNLHDAVKAKCSDALRLRY